MQVLFEFPWSTETEFPFQFSFGVESGFCLFRTFLEVLTLVPERACSS